MAKQRNQSKRRITKRTLSRCTCGRVGRAPPMNSVNSLNQNFDYEILDKKSHRKTKTSNKKEKVSATKNSESEDEYEQQYTRKHKKLNLDDYCSCSRCSVVSSDSGFRDSSPTEINKPSRRSRGKENKFKSSRQSSRSQSSFKKNYAPQPTSGLLMPIFKLHGFRNFNSDAYCLPIWITFWLIVFFGVIYLILFLGYRPTMKLLREDWGFLNDNCDESNYLLFSSLNC